MYYGSYSVEETDAAEAPTTAATTSDQGASLPCANKTETKEKRLTKFH